MTTNINHSRKAIPIVAALLLAVGAANATVYTDSWTENAQPASSHNGYITYTYHSAGGIQTMTVNPPADGDEFVFTGGKLQIMNSGSSGGSAAAITASKPCRVVFQNDVWARNFTMTAPAAPANVEKHFYRNLVGTDYVTVLENANLDDYEPTGIFQDYKDENNSEIDLTSGQRWLNRGQTLFAYCYVREAGKLSFQYQAPMVDKDGRKLVKVIKAELKQVGADIKIRAVGAYSVYSDASAPISPGFDVDALWIGTDMVEESLYTGGDTAGYGFNTVALKYIGPTFIMRLEGVGTQHINGARPGARARVELADVTKLEQVSYPGPTGGTIAFYDGSYNDLRWYVNSGNKSATGTFVYETTKPTSSPAVTNTISTSLEWFGSTPFVVKGIDGYPMLLNITSAKAFPTNSTVTVKDGGILKMSGAGTFNVGVKGGACDFVVEKGGLLHQAANWTFGKNTDVTLNGGTLLISSGDSSSLSTDLKNLTLRNGALIDVTADRASKPMRIGQLGTGFTWNVGGYAPSTNNVLVQFCSYGANKVSTNTFNVAKTGDGSFDADLVFTRPIQKHGGTATYTINVLRKIGFGTMRLDGAYTVPGTVIIEGGTIKLGASGLWGDASYRTPITLCGGGLAAVAGTSNTFGEMTLAADSRLTVEEGATMAFADLSSVAWTPGARLDITIPTNADRELLGTVKFGTSKSGLTQSQIGAIRLNGREAVLAGDGHVAYRYTGLIFTVR